MFYRTGISSFFSPSSPGLVSFSPFSLFSRASLAFLPFSHTLPLLLFFSFLFFVIFRALSRKLQSMPRRRAMEYVCVLVDSTALLPSPFLYKRFSLYLLSLAVFTLGCSLRSMWYRRRVSLFFPLSLHLFARPPRRLVYHAPFPRLIKRPSLEFSCVTLPIFISPIFCQRSCLLVSYLLKELDYIVSNI